MKKVNHIALVIDRSGSMQGIRQETINSINEQLDVLEDSKDDQEDRVTVVTFNGKVDAPRFFPLNERFTEEDYEPRGSTALLDAIGKTVDMFQQVEVKKYEDAAYLLVILSDGEENASKEYTREQIKSVIKELEEQGNWTFTFIGASKSALKEVQSFGFEAANTSAFAATPLGMNVAASGMACGLTFYKNARGMGETKVTNFYNPSSSIVDASSGTSKYYG